MEVKMNENNKSSSRGAKKLGETVSQKELAQFLRVSEWTIWNMRRKGLLPAAIRTQKSLRWRLESIQDWIKEKEKADAQFDPIVCERAAKARAARKIQSKKIESDSIEKKRGRPKKAETVEKI